MALALGAGLLVAACTPSEGGTALPLIPVVNGLTLVPGQQAVAANFTVDWHGGAVGTCALSVNGGTAVAGPCSAIIVSGLTPNAGYSATVSALDGVWQTGYATGTFASTTPPAPGISGLNFGSPGQTSVTAGFSVHRPTVSLDARLLRADSSTPLFVGNLFGGNWSEGGQRRCDCRRCEEALPPPEGCAGFEVEHVEPVHVD